jgi:hypothetical protein
MTNIFKNTLKSLLSSTLITLLSLTAIHGQTAKWERISDMHDKQASVEKAVVDDMGNVYYRINNDIYRWNGKSYAIIGTVKGEEYSRNGMAVDGKNLYISGEKITGIGTTKFPIANVVKWDLTTRTWSALPLITTAQVQDGITYTDTLAISNVVVFRKSLYAQSEFGGSIYQLMGTTWKAMPRTSGFNKGLWTDEGGNFLFAVDSLQRLCRTNELNWTKLGDATIQYHDNLSLVADKSNTIYVGGNLTKIGNTPVNYLAKWDGTNWVDAGNTLTYSNRTSSYLVEGCNTLAFDSNNRLYAGAAFSKAGTTTATTIARWNGTQWASSESGIEEGSQGNSSRFCSKLVFDKKSNYMYAFCSFGIFRYYTKTFTPPSVSATTWTSLGKVTLDTEGATISAMTTDNDNNLYIGGKFFKINTINASAVAKWDGTKWNAMANGLRGKGRFTYDNPGAVVNDFEFDKAGSLYAAGSFTGVTADIAENMPARDNAYELAKWDGTKWTALCQGCPSLANIDFAPNGTVNGGTWATAPKDKKGILSNLSPIAYIPKELARIEPNFREDEYRTNKVIAVDKNNTVYATGDFTKAGTKDIKYIAKWDGSDWQNLGQSINGEGREIVIDKDKNMLYVSGEFSETNNINAYGGAVYDIEKKIWAAMGVGYYVRNIVLGKDGTTLYANVFYPDWGENYFAKWNGSTWTAITKAENYDLKTVDKFGSLYGIKNDTHAEVFKWKSPTEPATPTTKPTSPNTTVTTQPAASTAPQSGKIFDGTSTVVSLTTTNITGLSNGTAVTIEYWFKGSSLKSAVRLQNGNNFIVAGWGDTPTHIISTDQGAANGLKIKTATSTNVYDDKWHHIAMTWEKGKPDGFKSYVDGVIVEKRAAANVNLPDLTGVTPTIGGFINGATKSELSKGQIARVRIWKTARTEAQIKESKDKATDYPADASLLYQATPQ